MAPSKGKGASKWTRFRPGCRTYPESIRLLRGSKAGCSRARTAKRFFTAAEESEVPAHAHGAQWGIVVTGRLHLTVDDEVETYEPGDTYDIPSGAEHSARLEAGTSVIDVFQDPDRYDPR